MKETIHIVGGTGRMGTFLAKFLRDNKYSVTTSGRKINPHDIKNAHIVCVSVPISASYETIKKIASIASEDTIIIDLSSVMINAQNGFKEIRQAGTSIHFLFGPDAESLESQTIVVEKTYPRGIEQLVSLFQEKGARVIRMDPSLHDKAMAEIQNLTHFINLSLATILKDSKAIENNLITPVFLAQLSAMTRVVNQPSELISEIQKNNPYGILKIKKFLEHANILATDIENTDKESLSTKIQRIEKEFQPNKNRNKQVVHDTKFVPPVSATVGYLGPAGTHSYKAAQHVGFKKLKPFSTISEVFKKTANGDVDFGLVPAQNTTEGAVRETFDLLVDTKVKAVAGIYLPIRHDLISKMKSKKYITDIYSHPQALGQCKKYLSAHFPNVILHETSSTVSAIDTFANETGTAFVAPDDAAELYHLTTLEKDIQDDDRNTTRFFIITKSSRKVTSIAPRTLVFLSVYNRVGVLRDILTVFANENINLSNIESRPSRDTSWDYHFFVELDAPRNDSKLSESMNILRQYCPSIKILGGIN